MCHTTQSGTTHRVALLPLRFETFDAPAALVRENIALEPQALLTHGEGEEARQYMGVAEIPVGSWIYVFEEAEGGWWLRYELVWRSGTSPLRRVPWGASPRQAPRFRQQHAGTTERSTTSEVEKSAVVVDATRAHVVVLSDVQLPAARLEHYRTHPAALRQRGTTVPAGVSIEPPRDAVHVQLIDFFAFADALHAAYVEGTERWQSYEFDAVHVKKRLLAALVQSLAVGYESVRDALRPGQVDAFLAQDRRALQQRRVRPTRAVRYLTAWMRLPGFEATLDDHNGSEFLEERVQERYAGLAVGLLQQRHGIGYFRHVAANRESWLSRYFLSGEPFQHWRKTIAAVDTAFEELLTPYIMGRYAHHLRRSPALAGQVTTEEFASIARFFRRVRDWETGTVRGVDFLFETEPGSLHGRIIYATPGMATAGGRRTAQWESAINGLGVRTKTLLLGAELLNLVVSIQALSEASGRPAGERALAGIGVVGSVTDAVGAAEFLLADRLVASRVLASEAAATRVFARVGIVGALCDYVAGVTGAAQASYEGRFGLAAGHAITALAATALGASAAAEMTGVAVFGLAAGPWAIVGVLLFALGTAVLWSFAEDPLEEWALRCPWGRESDFRGADPDGLTERHLNQSLDGLVEIIGQPRVRVAKRSGASGHALTVVVEAAILLPETEMTVRLAFDRCASGAYASTVSRQRSILSHRFAVPADARLDAAQRRVSYTFTSTDSSMRTHRSSSSVTWLDFRAYVRVRYRSGAEWKDYSCEGAVATS